MTVPRVLQLRRSDAEANDFILVHISQAGSLSLDLRLIATEGEYPYVGTVKESQISKLRAKNYHGSAEDWKCMLSSVLTGGTRPADGLEVLASVSGEELIIAFRHSIGGITQRLGTISLQQDKAQEIELFDWTGLAARAASAAEERERCLLERLDRQAEAVKQLREQLEQLLRAKEQHENSLLEKFRELLNSKKLKIRDQQRLLNSAEIDEDKALNMSLTRANGHSRRPGPSRPGKRKSRARASSEQSKDHESSTEDDHVGNGSPAKANSGVEMDDPEETPPHSDQETADEEDDAFESVAPPSRGKGKLLESKPVETPQQQPDRRISPPPRRDLPFAAKTAEGNASNSKVNQLEEVNPDDEETEGEFEDDEL